MTGEHWPNMRPGHGVLCSEVMSPARPGGSWTDAGDPRSSPAPPEGG
jgi:hypothetical protein